MQVKKLHGHPDKSIYGTHRKNLTSIIGFIIGIAALLVLLLALVPALQWINWLNIPLAITGLVFSVVGSIHSNHRSLGIAGIAICCAVIVIGALRLKVLGSLY